MAKKVLKPSAFAQARVIETPAYDLSDEQRQELSNLYDETSAVVKEGKLITGAVLAIDENGVLVDINYKSNGLIPHYEFSEHELKGIKLGDAIDVIIAELETLEGAVSLSYEKAKALKAWEKITKLFEEGKPVEGIVTHTVKGGLSVDIGVPAFLPGSQVDIQRVADFNQFIGQAITADIIKINRKRGNVIISRRKYLSDQRANARKKVLETMHEGSITQGIVKNITNYGAFIDIGGVDGLLHITDMTWGRISHPSEILKVGDTVTVKILTIDKENNKISLGIKQLTENPWLTLDPSIQVGSIIKGKISSIPDYGLFVEVAPGVEGLVHISEVSWVDRVDNLSSRYSVGGTIEALVVSLDKENRRMSLSIKQLQEDPWKSVKDKFTVGQHIKGPITNITDFGVFIQLMPGVDGLAHVSDLSWTEHIDHPGTLYKKGEDIEAVILSIDEENKKISLGIKQLQTDPLDTFMQKYHIGDILDGEVSKYANIGIFVKLADGIEGLVHNNELVTKDGKKFTREGEQLDMGTKRQFRLININKEDRKIDVSTILEPVKAAPHKEVAPRQQQMQPRKKPTPAPRAKSQLQLALEKFEKRDEKDNENT